MGVLLGREGLDSSDVSSEDEGVDIGGSFIGVDGFKVHHVADDVVLINNTVSSKHISRLAGDIERFDTRVSLDQRDHTGVLLTFILQSSDAEGGVKAKGDLSHHVGQLELNQLVGRKRAVELNTIEGVLSGGAHTELSSSKGTERDTEASRVEASERTTHSGDFELVFLGDGHVLHADLAGDGGAERELALDLGGSETSHALFENITSNLAIVTLGPHHEHISHRRVGNPGLGSVQNVSVSVIAGASLHATGVTSVVGFRETKAADELSLGFGVHKNEQEKRGV